MLIFESINVEAANPFAWRRLLVVQKRHVKNSAQPRPQHCTRYKNGTRTQDGQATFRRVKGLMNRAALDDK